MPYQVHVINLLAGDQKQPEYLKLNPNGRIPTIVDRDADNFASSSRARSSSTSPRRRAACCRQIQKGARWSFSG